MQQIPGLLLRIKELLDVYWSYQAFGEASDLRKFCDIQDPVKFSMKLGELGVTMSSSVGTLAHLITDLEAILIICHTLLVIDNRRYLEILTAYEDAKHNRPFADKLGEVNKGLVYLKLYRAYNNMGRLLAPMLLGLSTIARKAPRMDNLLNILYEALLGMCNQGDISAGIWGGVPYRILSDHICNMGYDSKLRDAGGIAALISFAVGQQTTPISI